MRKNQYNSGDGLQMEKMTPLRTASFILIGILIGYFGALLFIGGHRAVLRDPTKYIRMVNLGEKAYYHFLYGVTGFAPW